MKILGRINVGSIFKRHLQTFYDYGHYQWQGEKRVSVGDKALFLGVPFMISVVLSLLDNKIILEFTELIVTSLSIFIGLLFSLLTLIFDLAKKEKERISMPETDGIEKASFILIKELFVNIAYSILLSILVILFIFVANFRPTLISEWLHKQTHFQAIRHLYLVSISVVVMFLLLQFLFTLLMVLNRFFIIFNKQIES